jgi:hypothetical protein
MCHVLPLGSLGDSKTNRSALYIFEVHKEAKAKAAKAGFCGKLYPLKCVYRSHL